MKKHILLFFTTILFSSNIISQSNSFYTYLNEKGYEIKDSLQASYIKETIKINDSLWNNNLYVINLRFHSTWKSKDVKGKVRIGKQINFNLLDSISSIVNFNISSKRHGLFKSWFYNRNLNTEGRYLNGKKVGVWNYYHTNNNLAAKINYKNDTILRAIYYNEQGEKINYVNTFNNKCECESINTSKLRNQFIKIFEKTIYKIKGENLRGKAYVELLVNEKGYIEFVNLGKNVPKLLNSKLNKMIKKFKPIKPFIHKNRKLPQRFTIPIMLNNAK